MTMEKSAEWETEEERTKRALRDEEDRALRGPTGFQIEPESAMTMEKSAEGEI
jgi:hypothetical protein